MYVFNRDQFKPSNEMLTQCASVIVDANVNRPRDMRDWAKEHCNSFVWWESYLANGVTSWAGNGDCAVFYFYASEDATAFRLRWL
jgi:hypothetical protein